MKIEDNRPLGIMPFIKLGAGDCFIFKDEYYIKIDVNGMKGNVFNLSRNYKSDFDEDEDAMVTFVNAKVVIYAYQGDV